MLFGYFDNAATTELCDAAKSAMTDALGLFGNPSSFHKAGQACGDMLEKARADIAAFIKAQESELYFTSGGTESDNLAIIGAAESFKRRGNRIITTAFEHSAVLGAAKELENRGFEVIYLKPDESGTVNTEQFRQAINDKTILVSCMSANNETGAVLPIDTLKPLITAANSPALLHVDATQSFGKYPIYPKKLGIDLMTFSSHKIHGPKGVGALYKSKSARILPIIHGGEQQDGLRPGTEPTVLIAGFAAAVRDIGDMAENESRVRKLRDYIAERLIKIDGAVMNSPENSSAYVLNVSLPGFKSETLLHYLDSRGICVSSGSACSKGKQSHVLTSLNFDKKRADSALRISFSKYNTTDEADLLINGVNDAVKTLIRVK